MTFETPSMTPSTKRCEALAALANGIIPADKADAGAAAVDAGARLSEKIAGGLNQSLYEQGLQAAESLAMARFARSVERLAPAEMHELIGLVHSEVPAFYKQLRLDVCTMYLSDPAVWERIGFPGPSTASGGYPDFDQPQTQPAT
jgi:Gluconate 2-dehydrogenase subunit 3